MPADNHSQLANFIWSICNLPLETIEADIKALEAEILKLLREVTA